MGNSFATTVAIVNYFSSETALYSVASVLKSSSKGRVRVVVVDNSCDRHERKVLSDGLPDGAVLKINDENIGFGRACNQVFAESEDPFFMLLNPDAMLVGDALAKMQEAATDPGIGAVTPQAFLDDALQMYMPPAHPHPLFLLQGHLSRPGFHSVLHRLVMRLWRRQSLRVWTAKGPQIVNNICGGHVLLRRDAVLRAGGLFDERFFLYFEDADLFLRMRKNGSRLVLEPHAKVIHYYDQCGQEQWRKKRMLMGQAYALYVQKHLRRGQYFGGKLVSLMSRVMPGRSIDASFQQVEFSSALQIPDIIQGKWLLELSPNPDFIPAVGRFGGEREWRVPGECLKRLSPGRYYARLGKPTFWSMSYPVGTWEKY